MKSSYFTLILGTGLIVCSTVVFVTGCSQTGLSTSYAESPTPIPVATYFEHRQEGRIYVLGSAGSDSKFLENGHLPYAQTMIGAGPASETVVIEIDKKDPELQVRLWREFRDRNLYYAEEAHNDRTYVIGSRGSHAAFKQNPHLPYTYTRIGEGPRGETVVIEVDRKNPHFQQRLWQQYEATNLYYAEEEHNGRIYVLGTQEMHESFRENHHLPYTSTRIGAGPYGETVVVEVAKKNPIQQERLWREFRKRHPYYAEVAKDGRIYLVGSEESHDKVLLHGHLPYTHTLIGEGPRGETIVAEVDKGDPKLQQRLLDEFRSRHLFYAQLGAGGRLYVIGSRATFVKFLELHHLPYTYTRIGEGPRGETVVIEVEKKNPHLQRRLWQEFVAQNLYYAEKEAHGRIYVVGSPESEAGFAETGHLPYTHTVIGGGPGGKTVVFEVDKKNQHLALRLKTEFEQRHGMTL